MNARSAILASVAVLAVAPSSAATQTQTMPIDRWLIADAFGPDSAGVSQLEVELLDPPGERGVLPDRGMPTSGTTWNLYRNDGVAEVSLDSSQSTVDPGTIVYSHVYARLPEDRTLRLVWNASGCTVGRIWLNGRAIAGDDIIARFGAGWNTILLKLEAGDCGFGYEAQLSSEVAGGLDDVRFQASRPPGEVRTGPEAWVISREFLQVTPERRWAGDRLFAGLEVSLTAWGRSPISNVEVELKGVADGKVEAPWLTPGEPHEVVIPIRLDRLQKVLDAGVVGTKIRWDDTKVERQLTVSGPAPEAGDTIALDGWAVSGVAADGQAERAEGQIPGAAGWSLEGEWKIPEALAGQSLLLHVSESPGEYRLNGTAMDLVDDVATLCAPCAKGTKLNLTTQTSGAWKAMPVVRVSRSDD